ncbi:MAG TPA: extracellular solute-binding protein [Stellaceae bacterium]|nr:extracellular solute-binding protein [Stellaceae bacterium]
MRIGVSVARQVGRCLALAGLLVAAPLAASRAEDWAAERAKLVAAAEKEGEIDFFSQPNLAARTFLGTEWPKAFPQIKLTLIATEGAQIVGRVRIERQSEKYLWDVMMTGSTIGFELAKDGFVDPLLPELRDPAVNDPPIWGGWDQAFVDNAKTDVFSTNFALKSPVYNALKLAPETVAREGLQILFDPALKGKIYWHEPAVPGPGQQFAFYLARRFGADDLKRFILDQQPVFVADQNQVIEALAHGSAWLALGPGNSHALMEPYIKAGVPIDLRKFGNAPELNDITLGGSTLWVMKNRPHPNAARLFVNWLSSKDVQAGFAKATEQNSRRSDVASIADADGTPAPGAHYVAPQEEANVPAMEKALAEIAAIRKSAH